MNRSRPSRTILYVRPLHVYHHFENGQGQDARLEEIKALLAQLKSQGVSIVATLAEYQTHLTRIGTGLDNIAEDIRRIKEGLSNPGLTDAEEAQLLTELAAVADRVDALDAEHVPPGGTPPTE